MICDIISYSFEELCDSRHCVSQQHFVLHRREVLKGSQDFEHDTHSEHPSRSDGPAGKIQKLLIFVLLYWHGGELKDGPAVRIAERWNRDLGPPHADELRRRDVCGTDDDGAVLNDGFGSHESLAISGEFKPGRGFAVSGLQTLVDLIEGHFNLAVLECGTLEDGAGADDIFAIGLVERHGCKPLANGLLVAGMDISKVPVDRIVRGNHAAVFHLFRRPVLCSPDVVAQNGVVLASVGKRCNLNDIKREQGCIKDLAAAAPEWRSYPVS